MVQIASIISSTAIALRMSTPWLTTRPPCSIHQFGRGLVAHDLAAAADMNLGAELQKPRRHGLAEAGAATGYEDAPPGEKLIVEHRFHPRELSVNWSID